MLSPAAEGGICNGHLRLYIWTNISVYIMSRIESLPHSYAPLLTMQNVLYHAALSPLSSPLVPLSSPSPLSVPSLSPDSHSPLSSRVEQAVGEAPQGDSS